MNTEQLSNEIAELEKAYQNFLEEIRELEETEEIYPLSRDISDKIARIRQEYERD